MSFVFLERRSRFVVVDRAARLPPPRVAVSDFAATLDVRVFLESEDVRGTFEATCDPQATLKLVFDAALALLASHGQSLDKHRLKTTNMDELGVVSGTEPVATAEILGLVSGPTTFGPE